MADQQEQNPYAAVLADLERERDQINSMIAMIKRRMGLSAEEGPMTSAIVSGTPLESVEIRSDTFFSMSISEAIKKYLAMVKRPKRAIEIAKALDEGGLLHGSKNWLGTVQTTLTRMKGTVVKMPNGWGLMEWYPGRSFDKMAPATKTASKRRKKRTRKQTTATEPAKPETQKKPKAAQPDLAVEQEKSSVAN